jgi:molybdate transport system ATP-binding protein
MQKIPSATFNAEATLEVSVRKSLASESRNFELNVSFSVPAGITILFGASGAGKTTLLNCIAGIVTPDAGRIALANKTLFDSTQSTNVPVPRRQIGYVFQDLALFPHLTAQQNIEFGIRRTGNARAEKVRAIAESFRIAELLKRKPAQISGGERQRVALARALVIDPGVLLLDEPLAGLDGPTKSQIMQDLREWNAAHRIPIVYVTHSRDEVFALGEQVLVLEEGRNIAQGTPHAVMTVPRQEKVAQLAGFENIFDAVVMAAHETRGTMTCRIEGTSVELETPLLRAETGAKLRVGISAGDILLASVRPEGLSARNIIQGKLIALMQRDVILAATVDIGIQVTVHLTLAARDSLALENGKKVWIIVKTHSCHLMTA